MAAANAARAASASSRSVLASIKAANISGLDQILLVSGFTSVNFIIQFSRVVDEQK